MKFQEYMKVKCLTAFNIIGDKKSKCILQNQILLSLLKLTELKI